MNTNGLNGVTGRDRYALVALRLHHLWTSARPAAQMDICLLSGASSDEGALCGAVQHLANEDMDPVVGYLLDLHTGRTVAKRYVVHRRHLQDRGESRNLGCECFFARTDAEAVTRFHSCSFPSHMVLYGPKGPIAMTPPHPPSQPAPLDQPDERDTAI